MIFLCFKVQPSLDIITGTTITSPVNFSSTSTGNDIWSPNYPHSYDGNYDQVSHNSLYLYILYNDHTGILLMYCVCIISIIIGVDTLDY